MKKGFLVFVTFLLGGAYCSAHLDAGEDREVNGYLVDFGYAPEEIIVGMPANLAFNLVDPKTEKVIEPDHIWVRISSEERVEFAGTFAPEAQHVAFIYTFLNSNSYEITVRFKNASDEILAETSFDLPVSKESKAIEESFWQKLLEFLHV